jgi:hypothetical protein
MAQVVFVTETPKTLGKDEIVLSAPTFTDQIKASNFKASGKQLTSQNHLNQVITLIRNKYDNDGDLYESTMRIPYSKYVGLPFKSDEDISVVVVRILSKYCPALLDRAVEWGIKNRPAGTKTIYFNGPKGYLSVFFQHGITEADVAPTPTKKTKPTVETTKAE